MNVSMLGNFERQHNGHDSSEHIFVSFISTTFDGLISNSIEIATGTFFHASDKKTRLKMGEIEKMKFSFLFFSSIPRDETC